MIKYRPFEHPAVEVRLLEVQPSKDRNSLLVARLVHRQFVNTAYQALSYCWDQQLHNRVDIEIWYEDPEINHDSPNTSYQVTVGENLGAALRELRAPDEVLTIWADAICIDQSNPDERSVQVQAMYSIYSCAAKVIMWLGPAGEHTNVAIDMISGIGKEFGDHSVKGFRLREGESNFGFNAYRALADLWLMDDPVDDSNDPLTPFLDSYVQRLENYSENKPSCSGMVELLKRQYWLRVWVSSSGVPFLKIPIVPEFSCLIVTRPPRSITQLQR